MRCPRLPTSIVTSVAVAVVGAACAREPARPPPREPTAIERPGARPPVAASPQTVLRTSGVRAMQRALRERGYDVPLDGYLGPQTRQGLMEFQQRQRLAPTSMPDLETLRQLGLDAKALYREL